MFNNFIFWKNIMWWNLFLFVYFFVVYLCLRQLSLTGRFSFLILIITHFDQFLIEQLFSSSYVILPLK